MTVETPFASHEEAQSAYYGDGGDGGGSDGSDGTNDTDTGAGWGDVTEVATLDGGWVLLSQNQLDGSRTRWFVAGGPQGGYLNQSGGTVTPDTAETLSDMPAFGTEEDARAAHASWVDENGTEEDESEEGGTWGNWTEVQAVDPWHLFSREHTTEDRVQLLLAGVNEAGDTVYLHPGGKVENEQHIYESAQAVNDALDAYEQNESDGDVPDDRRPTGSKPSTGDVEGDTEDDSGGPGGVAGAVSGAINAASDNPLAVAGVAGAGLLAYRYRGEL